MQQLTSSVFDFRVIAVFVCHLNLVFIVVLLGFKIVIAAIIPQIASPPSHSLQLFQQRL